MSDAEMVERVAREVIGFQAIIGWNGNCLMCRPNGVEIISFSPLTDANDTQMVKDKLREMGWFVGIHIEANGETLVNLITFTPGNRYIEINSDTEAIAICEAALKAVEK